MSTQIKCPILMLQLRAYNEETEITNVELAFGGTESNSNIALVASKNIDILSVSKQLSTFTKYFFSIYFRRSQTTLYGKVNENRLV